MRFLHQMYPPYSMAFRLLNNPVNPVTFEPAHATTYVRERLWQRILFAHAIAARKPKAREHHLQ